MAVVSAGLGEHDRSISWLQRAANERDALLPFIDMWPPLTPLRDDPRFQALLRRMNFPKAGHTGAVQ